jgi:hypothetical protein
LTSKGFAVESDNEDDVNSECNPHGRDEKCVKNFVAEPKGRKHWEDVGVKY